MIAYCDGSSVKAKDGGYHGGAGVVLIYKGKEKHISVPIPEGTNNISEINAAIITLETLKELCRVTIYSDSMYTINAMTKWIHGWKRRGWMTQNKGEVKNKEIIQRLDGLCQKHVVTWRHVKGHSGDYYNDLADKLACEASARLKEELED